MRDELGVTLVGGMLITDDDEDGFGKRYSGGGGGCENGRGGREDRSEERGEKTEHGGRIRGEAARGGTLIIEGEKSMSAWGLPDPRV